MNTMVVLRVGLVLFLVGVIANNADARMNREAEAIAEARMDLLTSVIRPFNAYTIFNSKPSNSEACCDECMCTKSDPPQCRCVDIKDKCYNGCNICICARSNPPLCRCADTTDSCPSKCST